MRRLLALACVLSILVMGGVALADDPDGNIQRARDLIAQADQLLAQEQAKPERTVTETVTETATVTVTETQTVTVVPPTARGTLGWNKAGLPARRLYATWSNKTSQAATARAVADSGVKVLFSIKPPTVSTSGLNAVAAGTYDADFRALFNSLPDGEIAFFHEPENDGVTAASFRAAFDRVASLMRPEQTPVVCLMGWTFEDSSGRNWADWVPASAEKVAVDVYSWAFTPERPNDPWRTTESLMTPVVTKLDGALPVSVWETNAGEDPSSPSRKADWIRSWGPLAEQLGLSDVVFYDGTNFSLYSSAASTQAVADLAAYPYFGE